MALRKDLRVLVVDDMSVSRQILLQMLEQIGVATVDTARARKMRWQASAGIQQMWSLLISTCRKWTGLNCCADCAVTDVITKLVL